MQQHLALTVSLGILLLLSSLVAADDDDVPVDFDRTPEEYTETDVARLISIRQPRDVDELRAKLIAFLWGRSQVPLSLPSTIERKFLDNRYEDITSLGSIEKLEISMDFGLKSYAYHFVPKSPNNRVVLYHQGHKGDFFNSKKQIRQFLDSGFSVVAFSMPLYGQNNQPSIQLPRLGKLKLVKHDQMKFLTPENGHPVQYFITPIVTSLNYLDSDFDYSSVAMVGISGGGWTTTLAAAVDPRIGKSFPVAGSYPIYLRSNSERDWGDYEQNVPELYNTVNHLELYVMGAHGPDRKQLQVINKYDSCCFAGTKWETYKAIVRKRTRQLGAGEFDLYLDDSHKGHFISPLAMDRILSELTDE